ncbi:hypothetical protein BN14_09974 [Rhizoctonia solani AG-1 IB]|uniref:Uncharacterized protein n=1 Tax=Thanatephorus cucumeris (strain AG1-IB / isolate 7/3/14) TaxID=1108050 RepID=M5C927_THACB|nr:hypothetical protein BN14_09974 [Rhizoctonia solani AG-1 IB]
MSQVAAIACKYPQVRKALLFGKNNAPMPVSQMEYVYPKYEEHNIVLRYPSVWQFFLKLPLHKHLARFFCTNYPRQTYTAWLGFIPERCKRWSKLCIAKGGDSIRSAIACNPASVDGGRDSSFIRFTFQKDENKNNPNASINMVDAIGYGRLEFLLAVTLPQDNNFGIDVSTTHILAYITEAKDVEGDGTNKILYFTKFGCSFILNATLIKNVAGRVFTKARRAAGEWAIVDRSGGLEKTDFSVEEHDPNDEEGWEN